jgi:CheY-like chemotaxis protein
MPATILLVEDNPLARRNMMLFFKFHGYEVLEAQRGEEAVKLIRDVDKFDVVITDLRMPGVVDGLEVLRVQNEVAPRTKTILVTAYGSNQIKFQAAALGAVYLDKPVQLDDLLVHVRQLTSPWWKDIMRLDEMDIPLERDIFLALWFESCQALFGIKKLQDCHRSQGYLSSAETLRFTNKRYRNWHSRGDGCCRNLPKTPTFSYPYRW